METWARDTVVQLLSNAQLTAEGPKKAVRIRGEMH